MRVDNMHKEIKVSVLVPVYNVKKFLPKCFDALVNQTYKNLEIIFVDDASTDGSREYLENSIKRLKNAKLLLHDCNKNLFLTRITAMKECTGDYIICLDSDDYVDNDYYEALVKKMIDTDADMCIGDIELEYDNIQKNVKLNAKFEKDYYSNEECIDYLFFSRKNRFVSVWNKMISRRVLNKALLDLEKMQEGAEGINICEDNIFLFVFACYTNKLVCANGPKYHYVQHSNQSTVFDSKDKLIMQLNSLQKATDKIINFLSSIVYAFDSERVDFVVIQMNFYLLFYMPKDAMSKVYSMIYVQNPETLVACFLFCVVCVMIDTKCEATLRGE